MTRRATRQLLNLVLGHQARAELALVRWRLIIRAQYGVAGADVLLRIAVAIEAPLHLQRLGLPHQWHPIDRSMTGGAANPFVYVNAVVEVHEVRQIVHASPLQRFSG